MTQEKRQTSQGYIIRILQHFPTRLRNITNFVILFPAVIKFLSGLVQIKILFIREQLGPLSDLRAVNYLDCRVPPSNQASIDRQNQKQCRYQSSRCRFYMGQEYIGQHRLEIEVDIHTIAYTSLMSDLQVRTNTNLVMAGHFLNRKTKTIFSMQIDRQILYCVFP